MNQDEVVKYLTEFLNLLDLPGILPHVLTSKFDVSIIILRNINSPQLYNDTRLLVKKLINNIIEATILKEKFKGKDVLLPHISMILPFFFNFKYNCSAISIFYINKM